MKIFDQIFQRHAVQNQLEDQSAGKLLLIGILMASTVIFEDEWTDYKKRKAMTFELIILSMLLVLRKFRENHPGLYDAFEEDLFTQVYLFAKQEHIIPMLAGDYAGFVNSRFILDDKEFSANEYEEVKLPAHTAHNLFIHPLQKESGICEDLFKVMELKVKMSSLYELLLANVDFMVFKKYTQHLIHTSI